MLTQISGINSNGDIQEIAVDKITSGIQTITTDHTAIHDNKGYSISGIFSTVANAATVNYAFKTPTSGKIIHLKYKEFAATANKVRVDLYESPTNEPTLGTNLTAYNRNRNSSSTSKMQAIKSGMTLDLTGATMIDSTQFVGGVARSLDIEWNLKPNTWYIRTFTNSTGAAADISFFEFWYEE